MPQVGDTRPLKDGGTAVFDGTSWRRAMPSGGQGASAADQAYERKLGTAAAEETIALRQQAAMAPGQIASSKELLAELPRRRTGPGSEIGMTVGAFSPFQQDRENVAFQRRLNAFASKGVLSDAATIKPISNSDIEFLKTLQAGANQSPEANRQFLIGSDWYNQVVVANQAARNRWTQRFGSPNATDPQGRDFATFWMTQYPKLFPRPNFNTIPQGKGYDFWQQRQRQQPQRQNQSNNIARPRNEAEFNRLPVGARYVDPDDGKVYTKVR